MEPEVRTGTFSKPVITPADRMMAELDGVYYRLTEVADILGVHPKTLRRLIAKGRTKAPSRQLTHGGMQMYLYTPEDVEELRQYYRKEPDAFYQA